MLVAPGAGTITVVGLLSGWWLSLYVGKLLEVSWPSVLPLVVAYVVASVAAIPLNLDWWYHDLPDRVGVAYVVVSLFGALVFVLPILVNGFVVGVEDRLARK